MFRFLFRLLGYFFKPLLFLFLVIALLPLVPNLPPYFKFTSFTVPEPPPLEGKTAINSLLNGAERLFEGEIIGPEGFAILNGELYTTLHGGYVAKIVGKKIEPVVRFGSPCAGTVEEAICGRPLGIFAGPENLLYIADAYYGMFQYDVVSGKKTKFFGPEDDVQGRKPKLINSVAVGSDGVIYWSDSSSDVTLQDGLYALLADGTGRLIKYDPSGKKHTVLIDGLLFANGVALAPDESFVLVAETGKARVHRYWLKGQKAGQTDIFADQLPGLPDNLRAGSEGFLVSLVLANDKDTPVLAAAIYPFPYIRTALARALTLAELGLEKINSFYPNNFCKMAVHFIGHFEMTKPFSPLRVTLVVLNKEGGVVDTFHATDGSVAHISDAIVYRGDLYLGSPYNQYLGRVQKTDVVARFQKAFPTPLKVTVRVKETPTTTPKPATTTTPRPTTTTPKPTTTTTPKPTTTTPKPTTTAKPTTTTTPKPTTTTPRPTTAKPAATTTAKPKVTTTTEKPAATPKKAAPTPQPTATPKPRTAPPPPPTAAPPKASGKDKTKPNVRDSNEL